MIEKELGVYMILTKYLTAPNTYAKEIMVYSNPNILSDELSKVNELK